MRSPELRRENFSSPKLRHDAKRLKWSAILLFSMASTQAMTFAEENDELARSLEGAKLVGWNRKGQMCVWFGGYSFNVFDAARNWQEVRHFTSGQISGLTEKDSPEGRGYAKARMRSEGFNVVE